MITINSKKIEIDSETFQPILEVNLTIREPLEPVQDSVSIDGKERAYAKLGSEIVDEIQTADLYAPLTYQQEVKTWAHTAFGPEIANDKLERCDRFAEESLELLQACGYSVERIHALIDYVYNREVGELAQEVGGVMTTLTTLCSAYGVDVENAARTELARVWEKIENIREKQKNKPRGSALPS